MEDHLRDQARLQPAEIIGPFPIETEGMRELLGRRVGLPIRTPYRRSAVRRLEPQHSSDLGEDRRSLPLHRVALSLCCDALRYCCASVSCQFVGG